MEAPSGSNESKRFEDELSSTIPASLAACLMKCLCSSLQRAGTVSTHLILVLITLPTYSVSFSKALSAINLSDYEITVISESSLPSTAIAFVSIFSK